MFWYASFDAVKIHNGTLVQAALAAYIYCWNV